MSNRAVFTGKTYKIEESDGTDGNVAGFFVLIPFSGGDEVFESFDELAEAYPSIGREAREAIVGKLYTIVATYLDNGRRCVCDRGYALGQYADTTWDSVEAAEDVADDLRSDVGTVVDASVEYEVVEYSA